MWAGVDETQRYRVEARVAAAIRRAQSINGLSQRSIDAASRYIGAWTGRAEAWARSLSSGEVDLATAAFLVWSLTPESDLGELGSETLYAK